MINIDYNETVFPDPAKRKALIIVSHALVLGTSTCDTKLHGSQLLARVYMAFTYISNVQYIYVLAYADTC